MAKLILGSLILLSTLTTAAQARILPWPLQTDASNFKPLQDHFIQPNEWFDALYEEKTEGLTGAMVSVGTFRAFQKILYGQFSWAIIVDVDPLVTEFNKLNYDAIVQSQTLENYLENFPEFYAYKFGRSPNGFRSESRNIKFTKSHPLYRLMRDHLGSGVFLPSGQGDPKNAAALEHFYFNNENRFQKLKVKLERTNLISLVGSFTDPHLAVQIKNFLITQKTRLTLLDISNVMDYVVPKSESDQTGFRFSKQMSGFIDHLVQDEKTKIFFTSTSSRTTFIPKLNQLLRPESLTPNDDTFFYFESTRQATSDILEGRADFRSSPPQNLGSYRVQAARVAPSCRDVFMGQ